MRWERTALLWVLVAGAACGPVLIGGGDDDDDNTGNRFHAVNYAEPAVHGLDLKMQTLDCRTCHGANLDGGAEVSCDGCHQAGWRTNCTYCHGGDDNLTGAPPRDLDGNKDPGTLSFPAHSAHVMASIATPFDCVQCHTKPTDVMSVDHIFDDSHGSADVNFGGLSPAGSFDGASCSQLYCHGDGQGNNGTVVKTSVAMQCDSCHPDINSGNNAFSGMSGEHRRHMNQGITCDECHADVVGADNQSILDPSLHVNGSITNTFTQAGFSMNGNGRCDGSCHGKNHSNEGW